MIDVFQPSASPPSDFGAYWEGMLAELAAVPAAAVLDHDPRCTTAHSTSFHLYLSSLGPYRLYAYYSGPRGEGPFPAILHATGHASVATFPCRLIC